MPVGVVDDHIEADPVLALDALLEGANAQEPASENSLKKALQAGADGVDQGGPAGVAAWPDVPHAVADVGESDVKSGSAMPRRRRK